MNIKAVLLMIILISMVSCERILEERRYQNEQENYVSPYKGIYVGNYEGADKGTLRIEISSKSTVTVKRISTLNPINEEFYGSMIDASFNQLKSQTTGFTILGNIMNNPQNTYAGTWKIDDGNFGVWTVKKQ